MVVRPPRISKINISEASGPILIKFYVNHHWVVVGVDCSYALDQIVSKLLFLWQQISPIDLQLEQHKKKNFFSETTMPRAMVGSPRHKS